MELQNNTGNTVAMYLSDSVTNTGTTYFLFKLYDSHSTPVYFTAANESSYPAAYDQFTFTLTGSAYVNLTAGTFNAIPGIYNLDVYQMSAVSTSITEAIGGPIHYDMVRISGDSASRVTNTYSGGSNTIYVYSPQL